jgi:hypothetical protein
MQHHRAVYFSLLFFFVAWLPSAAAQTYDVVSDFSTTRNPNGVWSFLGNNTPLQTSTTDGRCNGWPVIPGLFCWTSDRSTTFAASIMKNTTGRDIRTSTVTVPTSHVVLFPSSGFMTVQWKAPAAGRYAIVGEFLSVDTAQNSRYVQINHIGNQRPLLRSNVYPRGRRVPFSLTVTTARDDLIQFTVQGGATPYNNNVALSARITRLP